MSRPHGVRLPLAAALAVVLVAAGCGAGGDQAPASSAVGGTVTVLAAASLTDAFEQLATRFEAQHPGVEVELSFDASSALATALVEGGVPADVFASADETSMERVAAANLVTGAPVPFATGRLAVVVAAENPLGITDLADLAGRRLALCAPEVPCGRYARLAFDRANVPVPPSADQRTVKGVVAQVRLGEADVGVVYLSDLLAATDLDGFELPTEQQVPVRYPAAVLQGAGNEPGAVAFLELLASREAVELLDRLGFGPP